MGSGVLQAPVRCEKSLPPPSEYLPLGHRSHPETGTSPEKLAHEHSIALLATGSSSSTAAMNKENALGAEEVAAIARHVASETAHGR